MKICQFNFNNEVDSFEIHVDEETGRVEIHEGEAVIAEYDSVLQLAEIYAQARDVKPENLKNWVLLENGNVYSFVLRAGTAGVDVAEASDKLEGVFASLAGTYHPLNLARAKEQIMGDGTADLTDALVHCTETDIARDVYDAMLPEINGTPVEEEAPAEEEDTRTDLEKYVDDMAEIPGAIDFFANLVGLDAGTDKNDVAEALAASYALGNAAVLRSIFENAISEAIRDGIGVNTRADALTVITQNVAGTKDDAMKSRMIAATRMAGRRAMNISVDIVGQTHISHTAEMVAVDELENVDLFVRDNVPYIVRFSDTIDAELEAERTAQQENDEDDPYDDDYEDEEE